MKHHWNIKWCIIIHWMIKNLFLVDISAYEKGFWNFPYYQSSLITLGYWKIDRGGKKILLIPQIFIHCSCNLSIQKLLWDYKAQKMPQSFKAKSFIFCSQQVLPHCHHFIVWRKKAITSHICVLSFLWGAPWVAGRQHCYPHRANTAKDSHCLNIFVCRTARAFRKW